jgi:hypothetical protein
LANNYLSITDLLDVSAEILGSPEHTTLLIISNSDGNLISFIQLEITALKVYKLSCCTARCYRQE